MKGFKSFILASFFLTLPHVALASNQEVSKEPQPSQYAQSPETIPVDEISVSVQRAASNLQLYQTVLQHYHAGRNLEAREAFADLVSFPDPDTPQDYKDHYIRYFITGDLSNFFYDKIKTTQDAATKLQYVNKSKILCKQFLTASDRLSQKLFQTNPYYEKIRIRHFYQLLNSLIYCTKSLAELGQAEEARAAQPTNIEFIKSALAAFDRFPSLKDWNIRWEGQGTLLAKDAYDDLYLTLFCQYFDYMLNTLDNNALADKYYDLAWNIYKRFQKENPKSSSAMSMHARIRWHWAYNDKGAQLDKIKAPGAFKKADKFLYLLNKYAELLKKERELRTSLKISYKILPGDDVEYFIYRLQDLHRRSLEEHQKIPSCVLLMEETIKECNGLSKDDQSFEALYTVYRQIWTFLRLFSDAPNNLVVTLTGSNTDFESSYASYAAIMYGAYSNDLEGSLLRLEVIQKLEREITGGLSFGVRADIAWIKTLRGEFDEWKAIQAEKREMRLRKEAEKKQNRKAMGQAINQALQEKSESAAQQEQARLQTEREAARLKAPANNDKGKEEADDRSFTYDDGPLKSLEEQKREKLQRHEEAKQRRALEVKAVPAPAKMIEVPADESQASEEDFQVVCLKQFFNLTGVAEAVDLQIENQTWQITREQLTKYFQALGCVYKPGKGSHGKLKLVKSVEKQQQADEEIDCDTYEAEGETIAMFVNGGGAVTLPTWEKGYIPRYLQKQVLMARDKIKASVAKAAKVDKERK